jgi:hypothetical protein
MRGRRIGRCRLCGGSGRDRFAEQSRFDNGGLTKNRQ